MGLRTGRLTEAVPGASTALRSASFPADRGQERDRSDNLREPGVEQASCATSALTATLLAGPRWRAVLSQGTTALTSATLPYIVDLAGGGAVAAAAGGPGLNLGVDVYGGSVTYQGVAEAAGSRSCPPSRRWV